MNALAKWAYIGQGNYGAKHYLDYSSIQESGNTVKVREIEDLASPEKVANKYSFSHMSEMEYDCKTKTSKLLSVTWYEDNLGNGAVISSYAYPQGVKNDPIKLPHSSIGYTKWMRVCGKHAPTH
jgi:hypothetical protein